MAGRRRQAGQALQILSVQSIQWACKRKSWPGTEGDRQCVHQYNMMSAIHAVPLATTKAFTFTERNCLQRSSTYVMLPIEAFLVVLLGQCQFEAQHQRRKCGWPLSDSSTDEVYASHS
jgi:hypothetical protein